MHLQEEWVKWEPIPNLSHYSIKKIYDDYDGLKIIFSDKHNATRELHVLFDGWVASYLHTDETYMDQRVQYLFKSYGSELFCSWSLFKVTNSNYLHYISQTSGSISDYTLLMHFAFFTSESILEVLASYDPQVKIIDLQAGQ